MIKLCAFSDEAGGGLETQIAALRRNNILFTELRSVDGKNVSEFTVEEAKEICNRLNGEGIAVWSVGSPLGKCEIAIAETQWKEQVKHICSLANALNTDKVRAFSFFHAYGQKEKVFDFLNLAAEIAKTYGVTLYHENEKEIYGDTAERVAELMEHLIGWKFIYDPANYLQVGETAENTLKRFVPQSDYFHIKDVIAGTGELVPAGEGDGDIPTLLSMIDKDTILTVEPHLAVFDSYAQIDGSEMLHKYRFESNTAAFDTAVKALKNLLRNNGWTENNGAYAKD